MSVSPHPFRTLWRRELKTYLRSMTGWCLVAGFASAVGASLLVGIRHEDGTLQTLPILFAESVVRMLPALVALATARTFAGERSSGTLELLLSAPVPDRSVVAAKFAGAFTLVTLALLAAVGGLALYAEVASPAPDYSRTGVATVGAMLLLHAGAWTAGGVLISLLTRRPMAAAAATFAVVLLASLLVSGELSHAGLADWLVQMDIHKAANGVVDTRPVVLASSVLLLLLFISVRLLESRRWKL